MRQLYTVVWSIELEAESPEDAAYQALDIQQDPHSEATVFRVTDQKGESALWDVVDMEVHREVHRVGD